MGPQAPIPGPADAAIVRGTAPRPEGAAPNLDYRDQVLVSFFQQVLILVNQHLFQCRSEVMERMRKCAASRYCRVHTAVKLSGLLLVGSVISIVVLFDGKV